MKKIKGLITTTRGINLTLPKPHSKKMDQILQTQALKRGGEVRSGFVNTSEIGYYGKHLIFPHHNFNVFIVPTVLGAEALAKTILEVKFSLSMNPKLIISYRNRMTQINREFLFGVKKLQLGNINFDAMFEIKSNDEVFTQNLINSEIQNKLIELLNNNFKPVLRISKKRFTFICLSWLSEDDYNDLVDISLMFLDRMRLLGVIQSYSHKDKN